RPASDDRAAGRAARRAARGDPAEVVVSAVLGLAISGTSVRAVLGAGGTVAWAGTACYQDASDLAEVIARLAAESGKPVRRARVALERDLVQLRTLMPAPPLRAGGAGISVRSWTRSRSRATRARRTGFPDSAASRAMTSARSLASW